MAVAIVQVFLGLCLAIERLAKMATEAAHRNKERVITETCVAEVGKVASYPSNYCTTLTCTVSLYTDFITSAEGMK